MAVNNFAPAEYGGYVLGANSGGGGGGLSEFDEMLNITGFAEVTFNFTLQEGYEPADGDVDVQISILTDLSSVTAETDIRTYVPTNTVTVTVLVPLRNGYTTTVKIDHIETATAYYNVEHYTSVSGDLEIFQDELIQPPPDPVIVVRGDGIVNATLIAD